MKDGSVKRKPQRLKNYDYSQNGHYFITICAYNKKHLFADIIVGQGLAPAVSIPTEYGRIVEAQLLGLEKRYDFVRIDKYVIMPNHIHAIVVLDKDVLAAGASPCPTLSDMVCVLKSMSTKLCRQAGFKEKLFQNSFHDHIIRNEDDYEMIWNYIEANPSKWAEDKYYL